MSLKLFDSSSLRKDVENDLTLLNEFASEAEAIVVANDPKLDKLVEALVEIATEAEKDGLDETAQRNNRKVLIFSYFKDTAVWIHRRLLDAIANDPLLAVYQGRIAITCGSPDDKQVIDADKAAWGFAPDTAAPSNYTEGDLYDIMIATDVLAEGVNLQQARHIVNYDLPWNPMRLIQRHGRIDRLLSKHKRVYLRTFFPDQLLDQLLHLEQRVRNKLALAAASVGVAETPIQAGAQREQSFSESRDEIEKVESGETDIFEMGGTASSAQTGEEYRHELRKALGSDMRSTIVHLPWKAGSGMVKGKESGHFFCAKVGTQTYLRFVPESASAKEEVVEHLGRCLRMIECEEDTARVLPDAAVERAYEAWDLAKGNIWHNWDFYTDASNLQPQVRKLNREVDAFLLDNTFTDIEQTELNSTSEILMSPWPRREENKLRDVWRLEFASNVERAKALIEAVKATGIEPYEEPARKPKIELDEIRLICWLAVQAEYEDTTK